MKSIVPFMMLLFVIFTAHPGELVRNATIVEVANTNSNSKDFAVFLQDGTGVCNTSTQYKIIFPESKLANQSSKSFEQAFSLALAAMTTGMKVRIHNFEDDSCHGANFISVQK